MTTVTKIILRREIVVRSDIYRHTAVFRIEVPPYLFVFHLDMGGSVVSFSTLYFSIYITSPIIIEIIRHGP